MKIAISLILFFCTITVNAQPLMFSGIITYTTKINDTTIPRICDTTHLIVNKRIAYKTGCNDTSYIMDIGKIDYVLFNYDSNAVYKVYPKLNQVDKITHLDTQAPITSQAKFDSVLSLNGYISIDSSISILGYKCSGYTYGRSKRVIEIFWVADSLYFPHRLQYYYYSDEAQDTIRDHRLESFLGTGRVVLAYDQYLGQDPDRQTITTQAVLLKAVSQDLSIRPDFLKTLKTGKVFVDRLPRDRAQRRDTELRLNLAP